MANVIIAIMVKIIVVMHDNFTTMIMAILHMLFLVDILN